MVGVSNVGVFLRQGSLPGGEINAGEERTDLDAHGCSTTFKCNYKWIKKSNALWDVLTQGNHLLLSGSSEVIPLHHSSLIGC